jgi:hypothetical protein
LDVPLEVFWAVSAAVDAAFLQKAIELVTRLEAEDDPELMGRDAVFTERL